MTEEQIHSNNGSYSAENIQVLEGLEAVRKASRDVYWRH